MSVHSAHAIPGSAAQRRAETIEQNLPLARRLARRYAGRGERLDDLEQVAALALIKAVDGYDSTRGFPFPSYAVPTIIGALKRHFRDTGWGLHVPRGVQELVLNVQAGSAELTHRLNRPPVTTELAAHLDIPVDRLLAAGTAANAYRPQSLDTPPVPSEGGRSLGLTRAISTVDLHYVDVENDLTCRSLIAGLPERDRRIVKMRFYDEMTQTQIAARIGVSQMHVSRLLQQSLAQLRLAFYGPPAN
jgi:RNA polymerase sigma-B factor